jgi:DNA-binding transcriptional regulator YhcF (GntR family)
MYKSFKPGEQRKVSRGKSITSWKALAKAAGFGEQTIQRMYAYYSGYVHADGLSGTQIVTAKTAQDQIEHIESHMRTVMIVLSKMILDYAKKFTEAKAVCDRNPDAYYRAEIWSGAARRLP